MQKAITLLAISGMTLAANQHGAAHNHHAVAHHHGEHAHHEHGEHAHHHHGEEHHAHHEHFGALAFFKKGANNVHAHGGEQAHAHAGEHTHHVHGEHAPHKTYKNLAKKRHAAKMAAAANLALFKSNGEEAHHIGGEDAKKANKKQKKHRKQNKNKKDEKKDQKKEQKKDQKKEEKNAPANAQLWGLPKAHLNVLHGEQAQAVIAKGKGFVMGLHNKVHDLVHHGEHTHDNAHHAPANAQLWGLPKVNLSVLHGEQAHALIAKGKVAIKGLAAKVHNLVHGEHAHDNAEHAHAHNEQHAQHAHADKKVKAPAALGLYELSNLLSLNQA